MALVTIDEEKCLKQYEYLNSENPKKINLIETFSFYSVIAMILAAVLSGIFAFDLGFDFPFIYLFLGFFLIGLGLLITTIVLNRRYKILSLAKTIIWSLVIVAYPLLSLVAMHYALMETSFIVGGTLFFDYIGLFGLIIILFLGITIQSLLLKEFKESHLYAFMRVQGPLTHSQVIAISDKERIVSKFINRISNIMLFSVFTLLWGASFDFTSYSVSLFVTLGVLIVWAYNLVQAFVFYYSNKKSKYNALIGPKFVVAVVVAYIFAIAVFGLSFVSSHIEFDGYLFSVDIWKLLLQLCEYSILLFVIRYLIKLYLVPKEEKLIEMSKEEFPSEPVTSENEVNK